MGTVDKLKICFQASPEELEKIFKITPKQLPTHHFVKKTDSIYWNLAQPLCPLPEEATFPALTISSLDCSDDFKNELQIIAAHHTHALVWYHNCLEAGLCVCLRVFITGQPNQIHTLKKIKK